MECPYCGCDNIDGVDFCADCGAELAGLDLRSQVAEGTARSFHDIVVADLDPTRPLVLTEDDLAVDAIELMKSQRYGSVLVVRDGILRGIFTEQDALGKCILEQRDVSITRLRDVMSPTESLTMDMTLGQTVNLMALRGYRHVPVVDEDGRPVGYVSLRGVLDYLHDNVLT